MSHLSQGASSSPLPSLLPAFECPKHGFIFPLRGQPALRGTELSLACTPRPPPVISLGWVRIAAPLGASLTRAVLPQGSLSDSCVPARPFPGCSWEILGCLFMSAATPAHWVAGPFGSKPCLQQGLQLSSPCRGAASSLQPFPRSAKQGSTLPGRASEVPSIVLGSRADNEERMYNLQPFCCPRSCFPCSLFSRGCSDAEREARRQQPLGEAEQLQPRAEGVTEQTADQRPPAHTAAREIPAGHKDKHLHCLFFNYYF